MRSVSLLVGCLALPAILVIVWLNGAEAELQATSGKPSETAIASVSEDEYCSPHLKRVLRRVAGACGLIQEGGRGCKPTDAKTVAALSGRDFNMLFVPLAHRAGLLQFDMAQVDLDDPAKAMVEQFWSDQRGASFFFVVARASRDGDAMYNQMLSQKRANAVLSHLETKFDDPDLRREVGLLWLGEEYAQLSKEFCEWNRSREGECRLQDINRSAFVAWIDCAI